MSDDPISKLADALVDAVVRSGIMRGRDDHAIVAQIMRDELEEFLTGDRYADERALICDTLGGGYKLAWSSLIASVIVRINKSRAETAQ